MLSLKGVNSYAGMACIGLNVLRIDTCLFVWTALGIILERRIKHAYAPSLEYMNVIMFHAGPA